MSAPPPAPGDDRPREGYYPDPSIPGYVRYWNGAAWVPGTSRRAPAAGEHLTVPPGARRAVPAEAAASPEPGPAPGETPLQGTGPVRLDTDEEPPGAGRDTPSRAAALPAVAERPALPARSADDSRHGVRPAAASAWQADPGPRSGTVPRGTGAGDDPRVPRPAGEAVPAPALPRPADGTVVMRAVPPGGIGSEGTVTFRRPGAGPSADAPGASGQRSGQRDTGRGRAPEDRPAPGDAGTGDAGTGGSGAGLPGAGLPGQGGGDGTLAFRALRPGEERPGLSGGRGAATAPGADPTSGSGAGSGAGQAPGAGGTPGAGQAGGAGAGQGYAAQGQSAPGRFGAPASAAHPAAPAAGHPFPQQAAPGYGYPQPAAPAPSGGYGFPGPQQPPAGGYGYPGASSAAGGYGYPGAQSPAGGGYGYPQPPAGGGYGYPPARQDGNGPVIPWKPPTEDPFLAAVSAQAAARPAGLGRRFAARLLDTVVTAAVTGAAAVPLGSRAADHIHDKIDAAKLSGRTVTVWLLDGTTGACLGGVLAALLVFGVFYEVLPTARWGRTLGKKLLGVEVRDMESHEPPAFGAALRRWLVYCLPGVLVVGVVGVLWCVFDRPWRQCWHDKAARTFVAG